MPAKIIFKNRLLSQVMIEAFIFLADLGRCLECLCRRMRRKVWLPEEAETE